MLALDSYLVALSLWAELVKFAAEDPDPPKAVRILTSPQREP